MGFLVGIRNTPTEITRIHVNILCIRDKSFLGVRSLCYKETPPYIARPYTYRAIVFRVPENRPWRSIMIVLSEFDFRISVCSPVAFTRSGLMNILKETVKKKKITSPFISLLS